MQLMHTISAARINQDDKIYCSHWIRHGECDYTQQGCRYKHVMPPLEELRKIGFKATPRWYVEENAKVRIGGFGPSASAPKAQQLKSPSWMKESPRKDNVLRDDSGDENSENDSGPHESTIEEKDKTAASLPAVPTLSKPQVPAFSAPAISKPQVPSFAAVRPFLKPVRCF